MAGASGASRLRAVLGALLVVLATLALAAPALAHKGKGAVRPVTVMTRNLFIGADLSDVVTAPTLPAFLAATAQVYDDIQASDFAARAKVLAAEIDDADPHLLALQEVELIRADTVPPVLDGPATPATGVVDDFLALLQAELAARGTPYTVVSSVENADLEAPTGLGFDARVTDYDVILARAGLPEGTISVGSTSSASFIASHTVATAAGLIAFERGWTAADVTVKGRSFRLVNTHLEPLSSAVRTAQAQELLAGPLNTGEGPVVLAGDINSPPDDTRIPNAYDALTGAGFADAWVQANGAAPGLTCCHDTDLLNPDASVFDTRIDVLLTRNAAVPAWRARVVGTDPDDRTPSGLWPSDHGGMWARLAP